MTSVVYFIQIGQVGPIKVGFTQFMQDRIAQLQCGAPEQINVLLTVPGGVEVESAVHAALADHRLKGEWFRDAPEVRQMISRLAEIGPSAYFGFAELCVSRPATCDEEFVGARVAQFLRIHYARHASREIANDFGVADVTALGWLAGNVPISKHMTRMVARWGQQFLTFVYEPVYSGASPVDRLDRAIAELTVMRAELKADAAARRVRDAS